MLLNNLNNLSHHLLKLFGVNLETTIRHIDGVYLAMKSDGQLMGMPGRCEAQQRNSF